MTETWYMGIDPGATGAVGLVSADGTQAAVHEMPRTELEIYRLLQNLTTLVKVVHAAIEHVNAFPGQGVSTMFAFGFNTGLARMALVATHVPYDVVPSNVWVPALGLYVKKTRRKQRSPEERAAEKAAQKAMTKEQRRAAGRERSAKQREKKLAYRAMAERLFPTLQLRTASADAVLIAEYLRRQRLGLALS